MSKIFLKHNFGFNYLKIVNVSRLIEQIKLGGQISKCLH